MNAVAWQLLDIILAVLTLSLAWASLASRDLKRAVVLFIAFGLLLAVVWARLSAPDLALAEAAIGAGLSGALLLAAVRDEAQSGDDEFAGRPLLIAVTLISLALASSLGWVVLNALEVSDPVRQADRISENLAATGVSNPVTAVLLAFRAYDTMLELAVLLVAVLGIVAMGPGRPPFRAAGPLFSGLVGWLTPLLIITAGYLLWAGAHAPGGAFQAGAMIAAAVVMLRLGGSSRAGLPDGVTLRLVLTLGVAAFLLVGTAGMLGGLAFLQYPQGWSGGLILFIEVCATLAIAATLGLAYVGGATPNWNCDSTQRPARGSRR